MFKNYCKIAWRNLLKNRRFTFLNLTGLSIGLCCTLLISLWIYDELTFDRFHERDGQLFQVMEHRSHATGVSTTAETAALLSETLAASMPEVAYAAASTPPSWFPRLPVTVNGRTVKATALFAGKDYFNIFSYPLSAGNKDEALSGRDHIVISRKLALELFHTSENIAGRSLEWQLDGQKRHCTVSGVFEGTPANSSVQFDMALPFDIFKEIMGITGSMNAGNSWGPFLTYVVLREGTDVQQFNNNLRRLVTGISGGTPRNLFLKPYGENYLYGNYENGRQAGGRISYVKLFSLVAIFILLIACFNFMNLSTAKAAGRMKEMGIRKTIGASRPALVLQYLGESVLMALVATLIAVLLVILFLPVFNGITGKRLAIPASAPLLLSFAGIGLVTGLLAGSYPALYLSRFRPVAVLKGHLQKTASETWVRKGLVVFQFTLSVIFIVVVLVVQRQINYVQSKFPGYVRNNVIYFDIEGKARENTPAFLSALKAVPGVVNASVMVGNLLEGVPSVGVRWNNEVIMFRPFLTGYDAIETLGMQMAAGRAFSRQFPADTARVILNEAAVKAMGISDPVGKTIRLGNRSLEIIGVVRNFHFQSLHETVKPSFIALEPVSGTGTVLVKIAAGMEQQVLERLRTFYSAYNTGYTFDYRFLDEDYQAQYVAEKRIAVLSRYFAGLAVFISCLGLFGLAAFTAEKRRKEIGIRKILGATVGNVLFMLSGEFLRSLLLAVLIAIPVAWWASGRWLEGFAYHIRLEAGIFLLAGGAVVLVTLLTISLQAVSAATANPVKSLKTE